MIEEKSGSTQIPERLMSSYGVNSQKDLAAELEIPANNISGWIQRDSVPGNAIIKCALDTGAELEWLVRGKLANAKQSAILNLSKGKALYDEIISNGGKMVLRRILDAYGFTMQKELCELLGISSGTVSTWVRRNYFPGDVVIACALETGLTLEWLATGKGNKHKDCEIKNNEHYLSKYTLVDGQLSLDGQYYLDLSFLRHDFVEPILVLSVFDLWLVEKAMSDLSNGRWLLDIDGKNDVYDVFLIPGRKAKVKNKDLEFTCPCENLRFIGKIVASITQG
ncbi:phage repressor protein CI [Pantoea ananatis]|uniref:phage repressor protein CI n=1 Tax=Pantoea ananas TaxID=553 RepID=UPI001B3163F5|nr:phage repressor protein CI [Pantoea ananatis]